jgi:hypothetical protein
MDKSVMKSVFLNYIGPFLFPPIMMLVIGLPIRALSQTHTMPGNNVVPSGASLTIQSGGTINAAAGSTVTGFGGGGGAPTTSTYITQTPDAGLSAEIALSTLATGLLKSTTTTGVLTTITDNSSNWNTAFTQMLQWDGGATNLVAATGRTSLGGTTVGQSFFTLANPGAVTFPEISATNVVSAVSAATFRTDIGAGTGSGNVSNTGTPAAGQIPIWTNATTLKGDTGFTFSGTGTSALLDIGSTDLGLARNAAGTLEINNGTAGQFGGLKIGTRDAGTTAVTDAMLVTHNSTGTPGIGFGESISFNLDSATVANQPAGRIAVAWSTATNSARTSYMDLLVEGNAGANFASGVRIFGEAGTTSMSVGTTTDPGAGGIVNANAGFQVGSTGGAGKILIGNGTQFVASTPTYPNAAGTSGVIVQSNGTNLITSTPTWPTTAGTAGYTLRSDGTNFASYPQDMYNSSTTGVSASYSSDTYIAGSAVVVAAGDFKAKGQYHCLFDMTKTAAGVGASIINVHIGTAGTVSDNVALIFTFGSGTAVADSGIFEVWVTFRSVGSGTSAVVVGSCKCVHQLATTGLISNAAVWPIVGTVSSGFASNTFTTIGLSYTGGASFSGTNTQVQATLVQ